MARPSKAPPGPTPSSGRDDVDAQSRALFDAMPLQVWCAGPDGVCQFRNRQLRDFSGHAADAGPGDAPAALHGDDVASYAQFWLRLTESQAPAEAELRLRRFDGRYRWFLIHVAPVFDAAGTLRRWYATNTDIDDLKRAASRLAGENDDLRENFRDLFDEAPIAYVHEGLDSRFIKANRAALTMLGIEPGDVAATFGNLLVANTPETQNRLQQAFEAVRQGREVSGVELELRRKDNGNTVWVQWWSRPVPGGRYTRTMLVDISERVAMAQAKEALEFRLESGQIGDWDLDLVRQTSRRSLRHDQCFGYAEAIAGEKWGFKEFISHVHPDDRVRVGERFQNMMDGTRNLREEFRVVWPDGSLHWLAARGSVYRAEGGVATRLLGIVMDITERKLAEEALRETKALLEFTLTSAEVGDWDLDLLHDTSRRSLRHDQCFGYHTAIAEADWGAEIFIRHIHPLDRERIASALRGAVRECRDWGEEFRVVWPDGGVHWLAARGSVYRTHEGRAARMIGIVTEITGRKRAEEALAASEQIARGQVEALTQTLDALALDETPDRLAQHISRTITAQLGAHSSSVWRRNDVNGLIGFEFAFEGGQFISKSDARIAGSSVWLPMDETVPWPAPLRIGKHCLIDDIRSVPAFALRDRLVAMDIVTVLMVPMLIAGRLDGAIAIRYAHKRGFRAEEIEFAKTLANQAVLAMQLTRLSAESRDSAVLAERNRMARDIHDTLAQGFTGVIVQLEASEDAKLRGLESEAHEHVSRARQLARESLTEARRSVLALRPQVLEDGDLCEALDAMFAKMTAGTGLRAAFAVSGESRPLPPEWEENLLRIGQEVLTNTLRHARAAHIEAELAFSRHAVGLTISDDGCGFDPAERHDGFGLLGMRERAERMGGARLDIRSAAGEGTTITVAITFADAAHAQAS